MEWQQLAGFRQVARLGSFTRAAQATFRSQSALSQQVKALEEELGCQLLERIGKRKIRLTEAGERVFRFAQAIFTARAGLLEELQELKGMPVGELRLAAPFTTLYHLCREVLCTYRQLFPQVRLSILDRSQREVIELVRSGESDFGIALASAAPRDLKTQRWHPVEMVLLTPPDHPLTKLKKVRLQDITRYPLILPPPSQKPSRRRSLEALLNKEGLDYHVIMESSYVELSSLYVELGLGISFATIVRGLGLENQRKLAFIPLGHYAKPDFLAVLMRKDKVLNTYKKAFLELLLGEDVRA